MASKVVKLITFWSLVSIGSEAFDLTTRVDRLLFEVEQLTQITSEQTKLISLLHERVLQLEQGTVSSDHLSIKGLETGAAKSSVYFHVTRKNPWDVAGIIPFDVEKRNVGNAMNLTNGVFTAPVAGVYLFKVTASWNVYRGTLYLRRNDVNVQALESYIYRRSFTYVLDLEAEDNISLGVDIRSTKFEFPVADTFGVVPEMTGVLLAHA